MEKTLMKKKDKYRKFFFRMCLFFYIFDVLNDSSLHIPKKSHY